MFGVWDHYREVARIGTPGGCVLCGDCASCYNDPVNRRTTTIALIAILIPSVCFAWGRRDGHRIVGNIAEVLLKPSTLAIRESPPRGDTFSGKTFRSASVGA